jgi:hypothetical protein
MSLRLGGLAGARYGPVLRSPAPPFCRTFGCDSRSPSRSREILLSQSAPWVIADPALGTADGCVAALRGAGMSALGH